MECIEMDMTPFGIAAKFSSAYNYCKGNKCPYSGSCNGHRDTCKLIDVAMLLRAKEAEIDTLRTQVNGLRDMIEVMRVYAKDLEDINARYRNLVIAFQNGYKPKRKLSHTKTKKPGRPPRLPKGKKPEDVDGNERYAFDPEAKPPQPAQEMVVI